MYNAIHRKSAHSAVNARGFCPPLSDSRGYCLPSLHCLPTVRRAIFTMSFGGSKANPLYESDDEGDPVVDALYDLMDTDGDGKLHGRDSLQACFSPPHLLSGGLRLETRSPNRCGNLYLPIFLSPAPLSPFAHEHPHRGKAPCYHAQKKRATFTSFAGWIFKPVWQCVLTLSS